MYGAVGSSLGVPYSLNYAKGVDGTNYKRRPRRDDNIVGRYVSSIGLFDSVCVRYCPYAKKNLMLLSENDSILCITFQWLQIIIHTWRGGVGALTSPLPLIVSVVTHKLELGILRK